MRFATEDLVRDAHGMSHCRNPVKETAAKDFAERPIFSVGVAGAGQCLANVGPPALHSSKKRAPNEVGT